VKILTVCDRYPYPLTNGQNLRIFHYVAQLGGRHQFDLLCYGDGNVPEPIRPLFGAVESFPKPQAARRAGVGRIVDALDVEKFIPSSEDIRRHLARTLDERGYDLVWVSGWDMIVNLPRPLRVPLLADVVDDGVLEYWRELKSLRSPARMARTAKWVFMNYLFERRYFGPADGCLFVSEIDAGFFAKICRRTPTYVVHNGVDADYFRPLGADCDRRNLVFEGNIAFAPNADGILWFCEDVLPRIRAAMPDVTLTIVGKDPPPAICAQASPFVEVTGYVDDVRPYVDRAAIFVCPLRKGAGIKNKVLQAWAMGKAVVATTPSTGGLAIAEGQNIVVRDGAQPLADAIVRVLGDEQKRLALGNAARATIVERYTWAAKARELERAMQEIAAGTSRTEARRRVQASA
jgi:glycosyltransferase involved in cell wall biosynthesis